MPKATAIALQQTFTRVIELIDEKRGMAGIGPDMLEILARPFQCQWAAHWKVDSNRRQLYPASIWKDVSVAAEELYRDTLKRQLSLNEGTAGHVWRSKKPVWTTNLIQDMCLPRSLEADQADLHGGIWFALKTDAAVYGVVEMLGRDLKPASGEILVLLEQLGISLGYLIETAHMRHLGH